MNCKGTCFDCEHARCFAGTYDSWAGPGEPSMAECGLATDEKGKVLDQPLFDLCEENEWNEDVLPEKCGHFEPKVFGKCAQCGKTMNSPQFSHKFFSSESAPVCSDECKKVLDAKEDERQKKEEEDVRKMQDEMGSRIQVRLACNGDMVSESSVEILDISEGFFGQDEMKFVCPECKCEHVSNRYGR